MNDFFEKREVKTYFLELIKFPESDFDIDAEVILKPNISVDEYLDIYKKTGENFGWSGRLILNRESLDLLLRSDKSAVFVLYFKGCEAGFYELDFSSDSGTEIVYFGLFPEFYGKRLGYFLMNSAIKNVFKRKPGRVFLHTCEFDSPTALPFYLKCGFKIYKTSTEFEFYPKNF